jgi:nitrous oxidase accessory protein NosD
MFIDGTIEVLPATVHNLNTGLSYASIQEAIDANETLDGHVIYVEEGIYYEHVSVGKSVTLIGESRATTIIDGSATGGVGIGANNTRISNFTIRNCSNAIWVGGVDNTKIEYITIMNYSSIGIVVSRDNWYVDISNASITGQGDPGNIGTMHDGVFVHYSSHVAISNASIAYTSVAIRIHGGSHLTISNCTLNKNGAGLHFKYWSLGDIARNIVANDTYGVYFEYYVWGLNFYHNSFEDNLVQIRTAGEMYGYWDDGYPSGGNYWSDYNGTDLYTGPYQNETGSDGIGDTPYVIDENNKDRYPLTKPYGGPNDIGITNLTTSKTVIGQGHNLSINVKMINYGINTETFDLTLYANTSTIQSLTNIVLTSRNSTTITFTWNTTGFAKGNYTIWAYAWPVSNETDTTDNTFTDSWVIVAMVGDITGPDGWPDGKVDMIYDIRSVAKLFGVAPPDPKYNPNYDINGDLKIDMINDIRTVAKHFGDIDP